uniref:Uncharacterized protein n=1 Tax=Rangifer tarandus platyrhynchus TaxID=3082113 RepID=A0ACB0F6F1_RANTA|nr:unnamed protein product [Rangifer tarandus platyrhynchus]
MSPVGQSYEAELLKPRKMRALEGTATTFRAVQCVHWSALGFDIPHCTGRVRGASGPLASTRQCASLPAGCVRHAHKSLRPRAGTRTSSLGSRVLLPRNSGQKLRGVWRPVHEARTPEPALAFPVALGDMPRLPQLEMGPTRLLKGAAARVDVGAEGDRVGRWYSCSEENSPPETGAHPSSHVKTSIVGRALRSDAARSLSARAERTVPAAPASARRGEGAGRRRAGLRVSARARD